MTNDSKSPPLMHRVLDVFVQGFPWVARAYLGLILVFIAVMVFVIFKQGNTALPDTDLRVQLFKLCSDGLKTVLGALMGSLSLAAENMWRTREAIRAEEKKLIEAQRGDRSAQ
jgi:hypothetical protein